MIGGGASAAPTCYSAMMDHAYRYAEDVHGWALEQAALLRARSANAIDWEHIAEEIEGVGKQQAAELHNRYIVLLADLLKWIHQPEQRSRSWRNTIAEQRRAITRHLRENPSLKPIEAREFIEAFAIARLRASTETDLDEAIFPERPPFSLEEARAEDWWPEAAPTPDES